MKHPNYTHLLYFWSVVREGGVAAAARELNLTPQTVSGQVKLLEQRLEGTLLERKGRRVVPTELGASVFQYADEIFGLGQDLVRAVESGKPDRHRPVMIGVSDVVPTLIAWRAMAPLTRGAETFRVSCQSGSLDTLVAELASHRLDLVLSTSALPGGSSSRAFSHLLGECSIVLFAVPKIAARLRRGFPKSLDGAPFLLPTERSPTRRILEMWFQQEGITPAIVAEFDDSALLKTFGQGGAGVFAAPSAIARELIRQCGVREIGTTGTLQAKFYALSMERRIRHPAVARLIEAARGGLFASVA